MNKKDDLTPPRYCVSIEIYDNKIDELIVNEGFNTPMLFYAIDSLKEIIEKLEAMKE